MHLLRTTLYLLFFVASFYTAAAPEMLKPTIDLNYRPDPSSDEGGFWYKVDKLEEELKSSPHVERDEKLNSYVKALVCKLAVDYCDSIRVYIIDNPHFNASMYPNGMMHVWTGLLLRVESEEQLVSVLSHEIAHYLRQHQITQWRKLRSGLAVTTILDMTLTMGFASLAYAGDLAAFSREQEVEADKYGVQLMVAQGYSPEGAHHLWEYISHEREKDKSKESRSSFFASHPKVDNRVNYLKELAYKYQRSIKLAKSKLTTPNKFVEVMSPLYAKFMKSHIGLREYEQSEELLKRHRSIGYPPGFG